MTQENGSEDEETTLSSIVATVITSATMILAFGLLAAGWSNFWVVFVIGFAAVLPLAVTLTEWYESRSAEEEADPDPQQDALDALRREYATGEIDEAEFERRVERLLETESVSDAEQFYPPSESTDRTREREIDRR